MHNSNRFRQTAITASVCISVTLAPPVIAMPGTPPAFYSAASTIVSNDIKNGTLISPPPDWAVLVLPKFTLGLGNCTGSFLSTRIVITARHCTAHPNTPQKPSSIAISKPGTFRRGQPLEPDHTYYVQSFDDTFPGDIALLRLQHPVQNMPVGHFPIYHDYYPNKADKVVIFGTSNFSNNGENSLHNLYEATIGLSFSVPYFYGPQATMYVGSAYQGELDPTMFPPSGGNEVGDSGGPAFRYLFALPPIQSSPIPKAIGVIHGNASKMSLPDGKELTDVTDLSALDKYALSWIGKRIGLITAPSDNNTFTGSGRIEVRVTNPTVWKDQAITSIGLYGPNTKLLDECIPSELSPQGDVGCDLTKPIAQGQYAIKAFREDHTYDEVNIMYYDVHTEETDRPREGGLSVNYPSTSTEPH